MNESPISDKDNLSEIISDEVLRSRILNIIAESRPHSTWSKIFRHPLASILVAGVVGASLTYFYDWRKLRTEDELIRRRTEAERSLTLHEAEVRRASEAFEHLSKLLDRRLYRTKQVYWAYKGRETPQRIALLRQGYAEAVHEWNEGLNTNLAVSERYFGVRMRRILEDQLNTKLGKATQMLKADQPMLREESYLNEICFMLMKTNACIYAFNLEMAKMVQEGRIGKSNLDPDSQDIQITESDCSKYVPEGCDL